MRTPPAVILIACLAAAPARAQTVDSSDARAAAAEVVARAWLRLVDAQRYGESWDSAAGMFRDAVTRSAWESAVREGRAPFEPFGQRELLASSFQTRLPNAPPGEYVVLQFRAKVAKGRTVVETVTPMKDRDGRWRVSGYYVRPE